MGALLLGTKDYIQKLYGDMHPDELITTAASANIFLKTLKDISEEYVRGTKATEQIDAYYSRLAPENADANKKTYINRSMYSHYFLEEVHDKVKGWFSDNNALTKTELDQIMRDVSDKIGPRSLKELGSTGHAFDHLVPGKLYDGNTDITHMGLDHAENKVKERVRELFVIEHHHEHNANWELSQNVSTFIYGGEFAEYSRGNRYHDRKFMESSVVDYAENKTRSINSDLKHHKNYYELHAVLEKIACYHSLALRNTKGKDTAKKFLKEVDDLQEAAFTSPPVEGRDNIQERIDDMGSYIGNGIKFLLKQEPYKSSPDLNTFRVIEKFINNIKALPTDPKMLDGNFMQTLRSNLSHEEYAFLNSSFGKLCKKAVQKMKDEHWELENPEQFLKGLSK